MAECLTLTGAVKRGCLGCGPGVAASAEPLRWL